MAGLDPKSRFIVWASCLGMLAVGTNGTAIMAALPTMRRDLGLDAGQVEWAVNAYLVVSAACIIPGGKVADQAGAQRVAMLGMLLFAVASVVIAAAVSPALLLGGRALQGLGAALAVPGTLAAIGTASFPERRAAAIGAWAGFLMLGFSIGPLMGGALTHYLGWRIIFWCNALAMLAATGGFLLARDLGPAHGPNRVGGFDLAGFLLLATFMTSLVFALHALPQVRRQPLAFAAPLALAIVALAILVRAERHVREPLMDLSLFGLPAFVRAVAIASIAMFSILALLLYFNLDAQSATGLSFTAIGAGLSLLPMSVGLLVFAFWAPSLVLRFGPRRVLTCGMLLIAGASAVVAGGAAGRALIPLAVGLFAIGAGLALPYATAPRLALLTLPADRAGQSSGIINACTFLGGSIGVAGGAIAFTLGGLSAVMALIGGTALVGAWLSRGIAGR